MNISYVWFQFKRRLNPKKLTKKSMTLLGLILIETLLLAVLTASRFFYGKEIQSDKAIIAFFNILFLPIFAVDGVINEKTLDLLAFVGVSILSFIYSLGDFQARNWDWNRDIEPKSDFQFKAKFILTIFFVVLNLIFSILAYREFGWSVYRRVGASMELMKLYKHYLRLETFFKVDLWAGLNLALMSSIYLRDTVFIVLGSISCLACFFFIILGWVGVRSENRNMIIAFFILYPLQTLYNFFVLYQVIKDDRASDFANIAGFSFFTAYLLIIGSLAARVLVAIQLTICFRNFGNGLRDIFIKPEAGEADSLVASGVSEVSPVFTSQKSYTNL